MIDIGNVPIWTMFQGLGHNKTFAKRVDGNTVSFMNNGEYRIKFSEKATPHSSLVAFDGFFLPHGLAGGTRDLPYQVQKDGCDFEGPEHIKIIAKPNEVKKSSGFDNEYMEGGPDYEIIKENGFGPLVACARLGRSERYFLSIPKMKDGSRSTVCQLRPRSLRRRYITITVTYEEVRFLTGNTY